jgi:hypothetical protein
LAQGDKFVEETSFRGLRRKKGRSNSPWRIASSVDRWISRRCKEVTVQVREKGSKLRRAGAVDRDHEERWFYSWIGISGVREVRLQIYATEVAIVARSEVPTIAWIVWATGVSDR